MFQALGTPAEYERHAVLDSFERLSDRRKEIIRDILAWLDKYPGPVERAAK